MINHTPRLATLLGTAAWSTPLLAAALGPAAAAPTAAVRTLSFRVLLDGRPIGRHEYVIRDDGAARSVRSAASFDVSLLRMSLFKYRHEAEETWRGDCLVSLRSDTVTNGTVEHVEASERGGELQVEHGKTRESHAGCVMSFAYWNPGILAARSLLNAQTGELLPVAIARLGVQAVRDAGRDIAAERYRLSTPRFSIDVWYAGGRWVALEAPAAGGRTLRYELQEASS